MDQLPRGLLPVARFCQQCSCGCPELLVDARAPLAQRIIITDDFGHFVQMSPAQLRDMVGQAQSGSLAQAIDRAL